MKIELSLSEVKDIFNMIEKQPGSIFEFLRVNIKDRVGEYLSELMKVELTHFLGRGSYERKDGEVNHRNGFYERNFTMKKLGEVEVKVPRDRNGEYSTRVLPRSKQYEDTIRQDLSMMFLMGMSTRSLSMLSKKLIGRKISPQEVSNSSGCLIDAVEEWRNRDLSCEKIKYLFIDGVNFRMRVGKSVELVSVLVVIGVTESGHKLVIGIQAGDKESSPSWREFFKDLKKRGLKGGDVTLGIMDGLPGLEKVFKEEFSSAKVQRCQVHVSKNVLAKVPQKLKVEVGDHIRSIFYASSKDKATRFFREFKTRWEKEIPSAVKCLGNSINSCLTFFDFPEDEWISLRTTNLIERLNKEFKRRTRSMEIMAGEKACYTLLAFICLKMELHWRTQPIGKVRKNLPFFKVFENEHNFTQ
jgi:putative transposase